ncbi:unnamed protein product [Rotaria sp. Silwood1]|nr:unnamed protein product [Rotaria sp. Silwood1]
MAGRAAARADACRRRAGRCEARTAEVGPGGRRGVRHCGRLQCLQDRRPGAGPGPAAAAHHLGGGGARAGLCRQAHALRSLRLRDRRQSRRGAAGGHPGAARHDPAEPAAGGAGGTGGRRRDGAPERRHELDGAQIVWRRACGRRRLPEPGAGRSAGRAGPQRRRQVHADADAGRGAAVRWRRAAAERRRGEVREPGRLACRRHRDHPPEAGAGRQPGLGRQPLPRPGAAHALRPAGRRRHARRGRAAVRAAEPELQEHRRRGDVPVGRPAPGRRDRAGVAVQGARADHGRALRGARPGRDGDGPRPDPPPQRRGRRHPARHARHAGRVRAVEPADGHEERPPRRHLPHGRCDRG